MPKPDMEYWIFNCPICDDERMELRERHDRHLHDLWEDFSERLAALAEAHAKGEHDDIEVEDA